jgi:hypothetical protein
VREDPGLTQALLDLRKVSEAIGRKVAELLPDYTDHSVEHMDALWSVADEIFTAGELGSFSVGEAFVLGSSFYVHDLGMAFGATPEGVRELRESTAYKSSFERHPRPRFG